MPSTDSSPTAADPAPLPTFMTQGASSVWKVPTVLWLFSAVLAVSAVLRLMSMVSGATGDDAFAQTSALYNQHLWSTVSHLVLGLVFTVVGPLQFSNGLRLMLPKFHKLCGYTFVAASVAIAFSALVMNATLPGVGGMLKQASNVVFSVALLVTIATALRAILRGDVVVHRAWMVRSYAVGMGVATQRLLLMPLAAVWGPLDDVVIGVMVWVSWLLNLAVAELILRRQR